MLPCHPEPRTLSGSKDPPEMALGFATGFTAWPRPESVRGCVAASTSLGMTASLVITAAFPVRILGSHGERDSAARGELRGDDYLAWRARLDKIVQNPICDRFVESALIAIRREIEFQRFTLDAEAVGHIIDVNPCEIRLPCHRTNRSEIVCLEMNPELRFGAGFGNVSRRASPGDAGSFASVRPSSVNWPARFDLAMVILC